MDPHLNSDQIDELLQTTSDDEPNETINRKNLEDVRRHLNDCADCQARVRSHEQAIERLALLKPTTPGVTGPMCPPGDVWLDIAAGIVRQDSESHVSHAAQCDHCGPLLRQAKEDFADELTSEENAYVTGLNSANTDWQRRMAKSLRAASVPAQPNKGRPSRLVQRISWQYPVLAVAAIALAVIALSVGMRMLRPPSVNRGPSVDQLLAQAYTEKRTMEVRIPQAEYSPLAVSRGPGESNFDRPASLSKAEGLITEQLQKDPNDPVWLDARARAELLDGKYDAAVKTLLRALVTQPDSAPLLTDLGAAYYMRGLSADHPLDYGNAIEALGKALAKDPNDHIALFNRALACEQLFLHSQAIDDWEHYLREDPQGAWAQETRERLGEVKRTIEKREHHAKSLLTPKNFPAFREPANSDPLSSVALRSESYQALALKSWLPETLDARSTQSESSRDARRSIQTLAAILERDHDDPWLKEFLATPPSPSRSLAIQELIASDNAVDTGRYWQGIELARQSIKSFEKAHNQAGIFRAGFALMEAQDATFKYSDCLTTAASMLPLLIRTRYRWLQTNTFIEQGQCLAGAVKLQEAIESNRKAWELAKRFRYPELELRATAFGASYLLDTGSTQDGLRGLRSGLEKYWQSDVSEKPGENLYSCLFDSSDSIDWPFVDEFALKELLVHFPPTDPVDQTLEREMLAGAEKRAGDYQAARETLRSASAYLDLLPSDRAVILRKAEVAVGIAQVDLGVRDASGAISSLAPFRNQVETAGTGRFQAEYFKTFGEAYLALGKETEAQPLLERALSVRENGLKGLQQEADKLAWSRGRRELYRDLLEIDLKLKTPAEALALWEWYKDASVRPSTAVDSLRLVEGSAPSFLARTSSTAGTALISYALLKNSIVVFVFRDGTVHVHTLQLPSDLEQLIPRFLGLCSDPSSNLDLVNKVSRQFYRILVAPLEVDVTGARALAIETDGVIDRVPFNLLQGTDGNYLGDKFEITFSQGIPYEHQPRSRTTLGSLSSQSTALVVVASGVADSSLPLLPDADQEGAEVASHFRKAVLISGRDVTHGEVLAKLRGVQLLHFAGHALAGFNRVGLVLGPASLLDSQDIATLRLPNLRLAVLSACDTANGDEGTAADVNSIARTLVAKGVPNVVASRWSVDSITTRQLMGVFYSNLLAGKTPAESLRAASMSIRGVAGHHHPYYWASFSVFGTS